MERQWLLTAVHMTLVYREVTLIVLYTKKIGLGRLPYGLNWASFRSSRTILSRVPIYTSPHLSFLMCASLGNRDFEASAW
jgi:hypothetical protein